MKEDELIEITTTTTTSISKKDLQNQIDFKYREIKTIQEQIDQLETLLNNSEQ